MGPSRTSISTSDIEVASDLKLFSQTFDSGSTSQPGFGPTPREK